MSRHDLPRRRHGPGWTHADLQERYGAHWVPVLHSKISTARRRRSAACIIVVMRIFAVTIDCSDPHRLARFYQNLLGGSIAATNDNFVALSLDQAIRLDFQRVAQYKPPTWPESDTPAQMHLDLVVDDLDEAERQTTALGGHKADHQPGGDRFRVFIDPAGHPFCFATPNVSTIG